MVCVEFCPQSNTLLEGRRAQRDELAHEGRLVGELAEASKVCQAFACRPLGRVYFAKLSLIFETPQATSPGEAFTKTIVKGV